MKKLALCVISIVLAHGAFAAETAQAVQTVQTVRVDRNAARFAAWDAEEASNPAPAETVLFVGSSTFTFWDSVHSLMAPYAVRNRGFGGSTMDSVLAHTNHFMRYRCTRVVVYEGENDMRRTNNTPSSFLAQCREFVAAMNAGGMQRDIYFMSIKTCPSRWNLFEKQSAANELLRIYAERTPRVHFFDINPVLLNDDYVPEPSLYKKDDVHLNEKGYALIAPIIKRALSEPE